MTTIPVPINDELTHELVTITPDTAALWLKSNTHNRNMRDRKVEAIVADLIEGNFKFNGDTIRFSKTGVLLDGQHRLAACAEADIPFQAIVVSGLDDDTQETMDSGTSRTLHDTLKLRGEDFSTELGSVAVRAWQWSQGNRRFAGHLKPTRVQVVRFIDENPDLRRSAEMASRWYNEFKMLRKSIWSTSHWILNRVSYEQTPWFFSRVADGVDLTATHSIRALRARLINEAGDKRKQPDHMQLAYVIRAWNAYRNDEPMSRIQHTANHKMPEPI